LLDRQSRESHATCSQRCLGDCREAVSFLVLLHETRFAQVPQRPAQRLRMETEEAAQALERQDSVTRESSKDALVAHGKGSGHEQGMRRPGFLKRGSGQIQGKSGNHRKRDDVPVGTGA
jgi:hypothetical protein